MDPSSFRCTADIVRHYAAEKPNQTMIKFGDRTVTWSEMDGRSSQVAQALIASGVASQERVAFLEKNSVDYFEVLYGCSKANIVDVSVNWRLAPAEILYTVNDSQSKVLFVGADFFATIESIEADFTSVKTIVALGNHDRWVSYDTWRSSQTEEDPKVETLPGDIAF